MIPVKTLEYLVKRHHRNNTSRKTVYVVPFSKSDTEATFFNKTSPFFKVKKALSALGYTVKLTDFKTIPINADFIIFNKVADSKRVYKNLQHFPKERLLLILWEPPVVEPHIYTQKVLKYFSHVLTWKNDIIDNSTFYKFRYPNNLTPINSNITFENKKLCTLINANKTSQEPNELYSERKNIIQYFNSFHPDDFDLYGHGWENCTYCVYRGSVENKFETLSQYKFNIAYENNTKISGYITEKIFDTFIAGVVPVYRGASDIRDEIPEHCFVDGNNFKTYDELYEFLTQISAKEYNEYLENISNYLTSRQAGLYSHQAFANTVSSVVKEMENKI